MAINLLENLSEINFNEKIFEFKENLIKSRKYWIIYLVFILVVSLTMFELKNYASPFNELIGILLVAIFGIFSITFYSYHNDDNNIYKTAFVIILLFGLLCCFLNPICNVSDEVEHLARADVTSQGVLFPEYVNNSFRVSGDIPSFFEINRASTVYDVGGDTDVINSTLAPYPSAFQQNPFYGYIPQAIGLAIAKLLSLSVMWYLWLGRIFNLICYAGIISYAVKKSPILKVPIIAMACIPVAIQQASSVSIDALFISLGILAFCYFFYMIRVSDGTLENKEIIIFSVICLLLGLTKLPFLSVILLLFFIPRSKFKENYAFKLVLISFLIVAIVGLLWSEYAMPNYVHSWRSVYYAQHHINSSQQLSYMISHSAETLVTIFHIPNSLSDNPVLTALANLYSAVPGASTMYKSGFISAIIPMFVGAIWFLYPNPDKPNLKEKIGPLFVLIVAYVGVALSQIISWGTVGNLNDLVIHTRYFIPLFVLVPFIFGFNHVEKRKIEVDSYIICLTVGFIAAFLIQIITFYY